MTLAWSISTNQEPDVKSGKDASPLQLAKRRVLSALDLGYSTMLASHRTWWSNYWAKSSIRVPNPTIERQWYLEQYKFGSASRRGAPPISLQAVWTADNGELPPWKGDFHHNLNTELSYCLVTRATISIVASTLLTGSERHAEQAATGRSDFSNSPVYVFR